MTTADRPLAPNDVWRTIAETSCYRWRAVETREQAMREIEDAALQALRNGQLVPP